MRLLKAKGQHTLKEIWEQYAKEYLLDHPDCYGKYFNKIYNYYIFRKGNKTIQVPDTKKGNPSKQVYHSMQGLVASYDMFKKIFEVYIKKAIIAIVDGEALKINQLGKFCMLRAQRDFRKTKQMKVDWGKTHKQKKVWSEEKQKMVCPKLIYFTDDDWVRVKWHKNRIKNDSVYEFMPAKSDSGAVTGFRGRINETLKANPLHKFNYLFAPIRNVADIKRKPFKKAK